MKSFLFMLMLYGDVLFASSIATETEQVTGEDLQFAENYLDTYYPQREPIPILGSKGNNVIADQTEQAPEFFGGNMTSFLDMKKSRRCGVPDIDEHFLFRRVPKWSKKDLTYKIMNYTQKMTRADVDDAIKRAFKMWSDVTPLTFTESKRNSADILIYFGAGIHHPDDCPFDGEGEVLAHAFPPYDTMAIRGDAHFDEDENWTAKKTKEGTNLFLVATHEFGHSLGLFHSKIKGAVMYASYDPRSYKFAVPSDPRTLRLHQNDIENIQSLYGCPKDGPCLARKNPAEQESLPKICNSFQSFNAVTTFQGKLLFFHKRIIIIKDHRKRYPEIKPISNFWPILKCGIDAAYEAEGILYLFKGRKYRTVSGTDKQPSDPKTFDTLRFPNRVSKIDAAVYDKKTKKTLFFSEDRYWKYDQKKMSLEKNYPRKIAVDFPRIGPQVDAAFHLNGRLYLFRAAYQFEFDSRHKLLSIKRNDHWLGCL
ncbi:matrix metalloproteinase-18-like [Eublepharis macularius]|uniref:Matrix metalloproteinase-18-like n=1 Tax=Eublepharis macularius TaxID=481883 RepID=A0AA97J454_EUBMA|nr:matrix metalloproteinase-18-like [Eublepharis macularius]